MGGFLDGQHLKSKMDTWKWKESLIMACNIASSLDYSVSIIKSEIWEFNKFSSRECITVNFDYGKGLGYIHKVKIGANGKDCGTVTVKLKSEAWCCEWLWKAIFDPRESGGQHVDEIKLDSVQLAML